MVRCASRRMQETTPLIDQAALTLSSGGWFDVYCGKAGSMGKSNAEEMEFWTLDEFLAFRDAIKDKPVSYMCFEILYWTGIREGELLALTAEDINLTEKSIRINKTYSRSKGKDVITTPKTKKSKRTVPIPDFLFQEVKDYMDRQYIAISFEARSLRLILDIGISQEVFSHTIGAMA